MNVTIKLVKYWKRHLYLVATCHYVQYFVARASLRYIAVKQTLQLISTVAFYVDDVLKNVCSLLHYCGLCFSHWTTHVVQHLLSGDTGRHTIIFIVDELVHNTSVILSNDTIGCM